MRSDEGWEVTPAEPAPETLEAANRYANANQAVLRMRFRATRIG
jgi:hypothetical protein